VVGESIEGPDIEMARGIGAVPDPCASPRVVHLRCRAWWRSGAAVLRQAGTAWLPRLRDLGQGVPPCAMPTMPVWPGR